MTEDGQTTRELLYTLMAENRRHAEQSENRRIFVTAMDMIAASGLIAVLAMVPTGTRTVPISLWMLAQATFGVFFCLKLHERALFHETRARALRARLAEVVAVDVEQLQRDAEHGHNRRHQRLASLRLNNVLVAVHVAIGLFGTVLVAIALH